MISIDVEKSFEKIQYAFIIKRFNKLGIEGKFFLVKGIYGKPGSTISPC